MTTEDQQNERAGMISGAIASAAFIYVGYVFLPPIVPVLPEPIERLMQLIRWDAFAALPLIAGIFKRGAARMPYLRRTGAQLLLAWIAHAALVVQIEPTQFRAAPILILWFIIAGVVRWFGDGPGMARGFAFAATAFVSGAVLLVALILLLL